ncbi:hypothetical protein QR680_016863 [Steinernema hermaphroditum]|uniref:C-type lectin domain-containing protein n=1 Tax=Steinernema hermaphroditum TaxID=289476 RepID=A0AA39HCI1_9BILA|nr:hypothetical protein QR680_016863 [Steinernema hermaphroditum]
MRSSIVVFALLGVSLAASLQKPEKVSPKEGRCESAEFTYIAGKCYAFVESLFSRQKADNFCVDSHAELVSIHSEVENQIVKGLAGGKAFWIGAAVDADNKFYWSDNSSWNFDDLVSQKHPEGEHCIYVQENGKKWNYKHCFAKLPFVCVAAAIH